jgi:hypothetical protein
VLLVQPAQQSKCNVNPEPAPNQAASAVPIKLVGIDGQHRRVHDAQEFNGAPQIHKAIASPTAN